MTHFYLIHNGHPASLLRAQQLAANETAGDFTALFVDSSRYELGLPEPKRGDMLYNVSRGSAFAESRLLRSDLATFYRSVPDLSLHASDSLQLSLLLEKHGIPSPRTIFLDLCPRPTDWRMLVDELGGFPVVVKAVGGSGGVGTFLAESQPSLSAITGYLATSGVSFCLRRYIAHSFVYRVVTIGNEVAAALEKHKRPDDFRSGVEGIRPTTLSEEVAALALRAAHAANQEFSGVDIVGEPGAYYVLEVNMPHNFVVAGERAGVDLSKAAASHLSRKARELMK